MGLDSGGGVCLLEFRGLFVKKNLISPSSSRQILMDVKLYNDLASTNRLTSPDRRFFSGDVSVISAVVEGRRGGCE